MCGVGGSGDRMRRVLQSFHRKRWRAKKMNNVDVETLKHTAQHLCACWIYGPSPPRTAEPRKVGGRCCNWIDKKETHDARSKCNYITSQGSPTLQLLERQSYHMSWFRKTLVLMGVLLI